MSRKGQAQYSRRKTPPSVQLGSIAEDSDSYRHGCETKHRFATRTDAKRRGKMLRKRGAPPLHEYACLHCGGFHITSKPPDPRTP